MNRAELRTRWNTLAPREKTLVFAAGGLIAGALLWWVALAPALATLRVAQEQHHALDAQLQRMLRLQVQAQAMQAQPRQTYDEALRQLEQAIRGQLGTTARYSISAERVTVTLTGVSGQVLGQWLSQVRVNARALPGEARLVRNASGSWDGTLVLTLPPR